MWLIQEIRRNFKAAGKNYSFNDMEQLAKAAEPFACFIDPDAPEFATAGGVPEKYSLIAEKPISRYLKVTGHSFAVFTKVLP